MVQYTKTFSYSEIDQTLNNNFVYDIIDIEQSIHNLLTTPKGSRIFLAAYGTNIEGILFELNDPDTADLLYKEIVDAIMMWEGSRVVLNRGACTVEYDLDNHEFTVTLVYNVKGISNTTFNYTLGISP